MSASPAFLATLKAAAVQVVTADGVANKTVLTGGTGGAVVNRFTITSDDSAAKVVTFSRVVGGVTVVVGAVAVPAGAGTTSGVAAIDVISSVFGGQALNVAQAESIQVHVDVAMTAAKTLGVHLEYGEF